ncbi:MAG: transporter substrate-binding domain-containing protein [Pseudomonadota bacterium]|nr:transporter substrate-binding domain-containing protein [Pseudomonadota bacterium]
MIKFLTTLLLAFLLSLPAAAAAQKKSAYSRVTETKTIRCGYLPYDPFVIKDPNTGKFSGITVDYINIISARHGLKVDWAAEVNVDQIVPALDNGRIDAFCIPSSPDTNWAKVADFSSGLGAMPYFIHVPADSTITMKGLSAATFAIVDGFALTDITKEMFPEAKYVSLPQTTSAAEMYDQLRYGKVQAHVNEQISAANYMKNNPGVIRRWSDQPVMVVRMFLVTPKNDPEMGAFMRRTFDAGIPENMTLLRDLMARYQVPEDALFLGDRCAPAETDKGWTICAME